MGAIGAMRLYSTVDFTLLAEVPGGVSGFNRGGLAFTPDGTEFAGILGESGQEQTVRFFDTETLESTRSLVAHDIQTVDMDISPDGATLATVGEDGFARLWDAETLTLVEEIDLGRPATAVAFTPDGSQLAVSTARGGVRVFHLDFGDLLDEARAHVVRGFEPTECDQYLAQDGHCPSIDDLSGGRLTS